MSTKKLCRVPTITDEQLKSYYDMALEIIKATWTDKNWADKHMHIHGSAHRLAINIEEYFKGGSSNIYFDMSNDENYKFMLPLFSYKEKSDLYAILSVNSNKALLEKIQQAYLIYDYFGDKAYDGNAGFIVDDNGIYKCADSKKQRKTTA